MCYFGFSHCCSLSTYLLIIELFSGAHSFNICYFYTKAELHNEYEDLCLMTIQKITAVPNDLVQNSNLQVFIELS